MSSRRGASKRDVTVYERRLNEDVTNDHGETLADFLEVEVSYNDGSFRGKRGYYLDATWFGKGSHSYPSHEDPTRMVTINTKQLALGYAGKRVLLEEVPRFNANRLVQLGARWKTAADVWTSGRELLPMAEGDADARVLGGLVKDVLQLRTESYTKKGGAPEVRAQGDAIDAIAERRFRKDGPGGVTPAR